MKRIDQESYMNEQGTDKLDDDKINIYEKLKDISDSSDIIELLTNHNLIQLVVKSSLLMPLLLPAINHYYPQFQFIGQTIEIIKLDNTIKNNLKKITNLNNNLTKVNP